MESGEQMLTFLFGAGSAGSMVGAVILYRLKKSWDNVDQIPILIKSVQTLSTKVDEFSGKLDTMKNDIHQNAKDVAIVDTKIKAAWKHIDGINKQMDMT
jgi:outer membrane murein-binding lipoprotein Lpp